MPSALWSAFAHPADRKPRARSQGFGKRKGMVGMPRPKKAKVNATEDGGSVAAEVDSAVGAKRKKSSKKKESVVDGSYVEREQRRSGVRRTVLRAASRC